MSRLSAMNPEQPTNPDERLSLSKAALYLLEECRMVLPGIQALLGFELTVIFNPGFDQKLSPAEQTLHLASIVLLSLAVILIMTPAAYHRQTGPRHVSEHFIRLATRLLLASMVPLSASIAIELYLVGRVIAGTLAGGVIAAVAGLVAVFLWFILPRLFSRAER
ncbi:hypothetical protein KBB96_10215 [Luteolibacter ambystomatis]|uniref:Sodium:proton antiporter n=1 Tax=Luteolibacter ambystomatis TaxID=2824561 RepID=A0A975G597_9BACT|nr:DUF6328 family protein [Luteolibacter ambystomatis]QUE49248.1 hypothetical protein KBB96_10215 [Luteolibacter ambystomatis]